MSFIVLLLVPLSALEQPGCVLPSPARDAGVDRRNAEVKVESGVINVNAGTHSLTWTSECPITTADLFAGAHLRTEFSITTFNPVGICGYTIYSETTLNVAPASGNVLTGVIKRSYGGKTWTRETSRCS